MALQLNWRCINVPGYLFGDVLQAEKTCANGYSLNVVYALSTEHSRGYQCAVKTPDGFILGRPFMVRSIRDVQTVLSHVESGRFFEHRDLNKFTDLAIGALSAATGRSSADIASDYERDLPVWSEIAKAPKRTMDQLIDTSIPDISDVREDGKDGTK